MVYASLQGKSCRIPVRHIVDRVLWVRNITIEYPKYRTNWLDALRQRSWQISIAYLVHHMVYLIFRECIVLVE